MEHPHSHNHNHAHGHHQHAASGVVLVVALSVTLVFALIEAVGGLLANSLALLGDAGHMVTDSLSLGLAAVAAWISKKPPSMRHSYGMLRAEVIAALVNAIFMVVIIGGILISAFDRIQHPREVNGEMVLWIALIGLLVNMAVAYILIKGEQSLNVRGALLHVVGDLLGSVMALISGLVIMYTAWSLIDPILSILICILISVSTFKLMREVLNVIMEGVPLHLDLPSVGHSMAKTPLVASVHDLHIWTLSSGSVALSAHIVIEDMKNWPQALEKLRQCLHGEFGIDHITLQPEIAAMTSIHIPIEDVAHQPSKNQERL